MQEGRGGSATSGWAKGGVVAKTGGMAGCCMRDRGSIGASDIAWDRGHAGATDMGGTRLRHDGDVRAKHEDGVAVDDRARGTDGMDVDRSIGVQRAHGGRGVMDAMVRVHGLQWCHLQSREASHTLNMSEVKESGREGRASRLSHLKT